MTQDTRQIEHDVELAVRSDPGAIAERVRAITVAALSGGALDREALREVMRAVVHGAQQGVAPIEAERGEALKEAVRGLDEALAAAAQATQLALQEAVGRTSEFSSEGLRHALDELAALERDFVATLGEAAHGASGQARATLHDLAEHMRASGSAAGTRVSEAVAQLGHAGADLARAQLSGGMSTLRHQAELVAGLAAGMLRGLADRLSAPSGRSTRGPGD